MGLPPIEEKDTLRTTKTQNQLFSFIIHPLFSVRFKAYHIPTAINIFGSSPKELLKNRIMQGIHTGVWDLLCSTSLRKPKDFFELTPSVPPLLIREGDRG
jgi:hypothetical protein